MKKFFIFSDVAGDDAYRDVFAIAQKFFMLRGKLIGVIVWCGGCFL